jgi:hypothetical protein
VNFVNEAIERAGAVGITVVTSAGNVENGNDDSSIFHPASSPQAITVASVQQNMLPLNSSCFGSCVDIAAPGDQIYSALRLNAMGYYSGTSQAAPFVTAAVATLKSINPSLTQAEIKARLKATAIKPGNWPYDYYQKYGAGVVDFFALIETERLAAPIVRAPVDGMVSISASSGVDIYYTTNGQTPTPESAILYTEPFDVLTNISIKDVKAISVCDGKLSSRAATRPVRWANTVYILIRPGEQKQLSPPSAAPDAPWWVEDYSVARVSPSGLVTAGNQRGKTIISASQPELLGCNTVYYTISVTNFQGLWWEWLIIIFLFGWIWYI